MRAKVTRGTIQHTGTTDTTRREVVGHEIDGVPTLRANGGAR